MPDITPDTVESFLKRFVFHDSRIDHIQLELVLSGPDKGKKKARIIMETLDYCCVEGEWVCMKLEFTEVEHFMAKEGLGYSFLVLLDQPNIMFHDDLIYVDLSPLHLGEKAALEDFAKSLCMIAAKRCSWSIEALPEDQEI